MLKETNISADATKLDAANNIASRPSHRQAANKPNKATCIIDYTRSRTMIIENATVTSTPKSKGKKIRGQTKSSGFLPFWCGWSVLEAVAFAVFVIWDLM